MPHRAELLCSIGVEFDIKPKTKSDNLEDKIAEAKTDKKVVGDGEKRPNVLRSNTGHTDR